MAPQFGQTSPILGWSAPPGANAQPFSIDASAEGEAGTTESVQLLQIEQIRSLTGRSSRPLVQTGPVDVQITQEQFSGETSVMTVFMGTHSRTEPTFQIRAAARPELTLLFLLAAPK